LAVLGLLRVQAKVPQLWLLWVTIEERNSRHCSDIVRDSIDETLTTVV
jgi:hypothetical protein